MKTIYKLVKFKDGLTEREEGELLKKEGMRKLTPSEFVAYCNGAEYNDYLPCRLEEQNGFASTGGVRHDIYAGDWSDYRFGVLGIKKMEARK